MTPLTFPDINVWLAVTVADHGHHARARDWWNQDQSASLAFVRITQLGLLRLLTTASVMDGKPLTMDQAWSAYDALFQDDRVAFFPEPAELESHYRLFARGTLSSPKLLADAWLMAYAEATGGALTTFDKALAVRYPRTTLL